MTKPNHNEQLLRDFHRQYSGASALVFGQAYMEDGRNSYEQLAALAGSEAKDVLDLACGDGSMLLLLEAAGHRCTGVDMSPEELSHARNKLGAEVRLVEARAQALSFDDGIFDVVLSHMAFMLMGELENVIAEVQRILRPGGRFVATIQRKVDNPHAASFFSALRRLIKKDEFQTPT
jgi:ubiquinone/menaquinone biosynthesis C-methylase UbiE